MRRRLVLALALCVIPAIGWGQGVPRLEYEFKDNGQPVSLATVQGWSQTISFNGGPQEPIKPTCVQTSPTVVTCATPLPSPVPRQITVTASNAHDAKAGSYTGEGVLPPVNIKVVITVSVP